jgi:serine O-acetyltransferase
MNMKFKELLDKVERDFASYNQNTVKDKLFTLYFNVEFKLLLNYRICNYLVNSNSMFKWLLPFYLKRQRIKYGCIISPFAEIGDNFRFAHSLGITIGPVKIGNNVTIFQQVALGSHGLSNKDKGYPVIEDNVKVYAGARILGDVTIGHDSVIGANVVVTKSVPPYTLIVSNGYKKITDENVIRFV